MDDDVVEIRYELRDFLDNYVNSENFVNSVTEKSRTDGFWFFFGNFGNPNDGSGDDCEEDEAESDDHGSSGGVSDDESSEENIDEGRFEEDDPAKFHELVIAETRHRPAD